MKPTAAIVQQAEMSIEQICADIDQEYTANQRSYWVMGERALKAKEQHNLTDEEVAERCQPSADSIKQYRLTFERFGDVYQCDTYHNLTWSHFYAARTWTDAEEALSVASLNQFSVDQMRKWYKIQVDNNQPDDDITGEIDLRDDDAEDSTFCEKRVIPQPEKPVAPAPAKRETVTQETSESSDLEVSGNPSEDSPQLPQEEHSEAVQRIVNITEATTAVHNLVNVAKEHYTVDQTLELVQAFRSGIRVLEKEKAC